MAADGDVKDQVQMIDEIAADRAAAAVGGPLIETGGFVQGLANVEATLITLSSQIDAQEASLIAGYRQDAETTMAGYQYNLAVTSGSLRYLGAVDQADLEANAITAIAGYDTALIGAQVAAAVAQVTGEADAQLQEAQAVAGIEVAGTARRAAIASSEASQVATVQASRTTQIATIDAAVITTSATIDQAQGIVLATLQATEPAQLAAIRVAELGQQATVRVDQYGADATIQATLTASLAGIQVNEINQETGYEVGEIGGTASQRYRGATVAASLRAAERTSEASLRGVTDISVATTRFGYERYAAVDRQSGVHIRADRSLTATEFEAIQSENLVEYRATTDYNTDVTTANLNLHGTEYAADGDFTRRTSAAVTEAAAREFAADRDLQGTEFQQDTRTAILTARLAYLLGKWNLLYNGPWPQAQLPRTIPGFQSVLPEISIRPTFTPSQVQQQVNAGYAKAAQAEAIALRQATDDAAGRGFTAASPALFLERARLAGVKLRAIAAADFDVAPADANAQRVLAAQTLRSQLFMAQQEAYTQAEAETLKRLVETLDAMTRIAESS